MLHGLLAHGLAEAMLSAAGMLGSLDLLFNPTGLLHSLGHAWGSLLLGPLAAIEARSPSQVCPSAAFPLLAVFMLLFIVLLPSVGPSSSCYAALQHSLLLLLQATVMQQSLLFPL